MTMKKTYDEKSDRFHYDAGPDGHVVMLGAASAGVVTLPDGTQIDTTPDVVEVPSQLHGVQLVAAVQGGQPDAITQEHIEAANDPDETEKTAELAGLMAPASQELDTEFGVEHTTDGE